VWQARPAHFFRRACLSGISSIAGRCGAVFTCCTYGTGRWVGLEVTDILPLWGIGYGRAAGGGRKAAVAFGECWRVLLRPT
jgi:hypothetical protein